MQRGERGVSDHPMRGSERHRRAGRRGRPAHRGGSDPHLGQVDVRSLLPVPSSSRRVRPTRRPHPPLRARGPPRHDHAGRAPAARVRSRRAGASRAVKTPPAELIRRKRDGAALGDEELAHLVAGIVDGSVSDGPVAAFAMAVYVRGMTRDDGVATQALAPADRRLYAIRDVTATADSIPLITASILSKKLAAGLDALVMDVKVGSGALVPTLDGATALAESLVTVAGSAGLRTVALLTDMGQVLGDDVGNALEIREVIDFLTGKRREARLGAVTAALASELLVLGGAAGNLADAVAAVDRVLASGAAAERFARMVAALGGPKDLVEHPDRHLPTSPVTLPVMPHRPGIITCVDARALGLAVVDLGGGRRRADDAVDPAVGLSGVRGPGQSVGPAQPIAVVHARSAAQAETAATAIRSAVTAEEAPSLGIRPPVLRRVPSGTP